MAYTLVPTELIVDGAVTSAKLDTNIAISGTLGVTGELTLATHMNMGDNDKIKMGTGGDLEIYHDGSNSYISNSTGNIYLVDTNGSVHIQAKLNEESIVCTADGAVTLYHDNVAKLFTSSTGATITSSGAERFDVIITSGGTFTQSYNSSTSAFEDYTSSSLNQIFKTGSSPAEAMRINSGGDLLIGTTSGTAVKLNVQSSKANGLAAELANTQSSTGSGIVVKGGNNSSTYSADFRDYNNTSLMRVRGDGTIGISNTSPNANLHIGSSNATGDTTNPALQIGGSSTYRLGMYTSTEGAVIENKNGDDGIQFRVKTAGEAMRIDGGTGDVFIGATSQNTGGFGSVSPQLQVAGSMPQVLLHETDTDKDGYIGISGSVMFIQTADAIPIRFGTNDAERMRIDTSGRVGIATTTNHAGSALGYGLTIDSGGYGGSGLEIHRTGNSRFELYQNSSGGQYLDALGTTPFMAIATGGTERMRIDSSGSLGLGTSSPQSLVHVHTSSAGSNYIRISNGDTGSGSGDGFLVGVASDEAATIWNLENTRMAFGTNNAERMRIESTGEVHITSGATAIAPTIKHGGATGDLAKLRLINRSGQGADKGGLLELGAVTDDGVSRSDVFASVAGLKDNATSGNKAGYMQFMTSNGSSLAEKMRLDSNGLLLINQTSSNLTHGKLQVSAGGETAGHGGIVGFFDTDTSVGSSNVIQVIWFSGDNDATGGVFTRYRDGNSILGQVTAANGTQVSYGVSSDERLKENIVDASSQLDVINSIQVREFDWKVNGYHEVGMIAQELHAVVPSVVQEGGDDITEEPWTVDYGKLTPYLIKAIQEQQTIINDLKSRIETLEG